VKITDDFVLNKNRACWIKNNLAESDRDKFIDWMDERSIEDDQLLATEFIQELTEEVDGEDIYFAELIDRSLMSFRKEIFKQELGRHLQKKGLFIDPTKRFLDIVAYQKTSQFDNEYDQYRKINLNWIAKRKELSFNFSSENTLVTVSAIDVDDGETVLNTDKQLVYRSDKKIIAKSFCPAPIKKKLVGAPKKFNYKDRYEKLINFAASILYDFNSIYFRLDKTGLKNVDPDDFHNVFSQQNLMTFGNDKTAINAVIGMREYGPLRKAESSEKKRLLFIYQNRNDANTLYRYLKNGHKHFPGLLSYVGIPVALADPYKGLPYTDTATLPNVIDDFLNQYYPNTLYPDTLAIIIGPFKRYESDEHESENYYRIKKLLLEKGIASQFINADTLNSSSVQYSLPNISIAILAKLGGIPWKLATKKKNELIIGFNTKQVENSQYLGSAVFFDNEGRLGAVKSLPINNKTALIESLKGAITNYAATIGDLDRLVIHYYKPPRKDEISNILKLLEDMSLTIPVAVVEVNDSKSKLDICFDADFNMGMPDSGAYVRIGYDEYLLFNNNRYKKNPPRKIDDELPIKLKLSYVNTGGFNSHELIAQVYEFSRLNWKGLKQRSVPVTTTYSKAIAEYASYFNGEIPDNEVANNIPWFI